MIFHDRVRVFLLETGGTDAYGNPVEEWVDKGTVPAEVAPATSDTDAGTGIVVTRYRIILAPRIEIPSDVRDSLRIAWGDFTERPGYPDMRLRVDGAVERRTIGRRLHHYEMLTKAAV